MVNQEADVARGGEGLKIGVWIEDGIVFRRDSEKHPFARQYRPKEPSGIEKVRSLVNSLHSGATMPHWTAQVEAQQDETVRELQKLIKEEGPPDLGGGWESEG